MNPKIKDVAGGNRSRMGGVVSFLVQEKNEIIICSATISLLLSRMGSMRNSL